MSSAPPASSAPAATAIDSAARAAQWESEAQSRRALLLPHGVVPREVAQKLSGAEFFAAIARGELPPPLMGRLMGMVPIEFGEGRFVFQGTPGHEHLNPLGGVHGGYAATLLDSCVGCAIHSLLPAGKGFTTLELKVNYLRGLTEKTGPVRAEGKVIHLGSQVAAAEGRLTDAGGRLYAFATTTCLIFPV